MFAGSPPITSYGRRSPTQARRTAASSATSAPSGAMLPMLHQLPSGGQVLPASFGQEQQRDEAEPVACGGERQRVAEPDPRRRSTDRGRPDRTDPTPDVIAEALSCAAQLGRI